MKRWTGLATVPLALLAGGTMLTAPLGAQITEVARTPIADAAHLTFGYLCDDRFVIRNEGTKPIELAYGVEKGTEHTTLALSARETVELESRSKSAMELWMDGKLIAKASKEKRKCKDVRGNASVTVTPLDVSTDERARPHYAYGMSYPFYDPWGFSSFYGYGSYAYRPYYRVVRYPVVIGGGTRRGGGRRR